MFPKNETAEYVLASTGAALWIVTIIPQIFKSYKTKSTEGLSPWLMVLWASSSLFFGSYVIAEHLNLAIQIQPHAFGTLCMISWAQCFYYSRGYTARQAAGCLLAVLAVAAAFETTSIFTLWYYEIYRLGQVKGISLIFLSVDISGGTLSAFALFFRSQLDIVALITYISVALLDLIIIILYFTLRPRHTSARPPRHILDSESQLVPTSILLNGRPDGQVVAIGMEEDKWVMSPSLSTPGVAEGFDLTPLSDSSDKRFFPG